MNLILKSKQDYGTHFDEFNEKFPCSVRTEEEKLIIEFENSLIIIEKNKIIQQRGENKIIIEPNKVNECDYETEHGMFVLDIRGLDVKTSFKENGCIAKARYEILIVGVEPYINEIEILIEE